MQIYWNKKMHLHEKRSQLAEDCFGTLNMVAVSLFWNTNMVAVACENALKRGRIVLAFTLPSRRRAILVLSSVIVKNSEMSQSIEK